MASGSAGQKTGGGGGAGRNATRTTTEARKRQQALRAGMSGGNAADARRENAYRDSLRQMDAKAFQAESNAVSRRMSIERNLNAQGKRMNPMTVSKSNAVRAEKARRRGYKLKNR